MGVPQVPAPQRIIPIDEIELGVGNIVYKDRVELRKNDAKKQEGIVDVIATILEQSCHSNDSLQVVPRALLDPSIPPSPQKWQCACMGPWWGNIDICTDRWGAASRKYRTLCERGGAGRLHWERVCDARFFLGSRRGHCCRAARGIG
jgi:hypothetical protein